MKALSNILSSISTVSKNLRSNLEVQAIAALLWLSLVITKVWRQQDHKPSFSKTSTKLLNLKPHLNHKFLHSL